MELVKKTVNGETIFFIEGRIDVNSSHALETALFEHIKDEKTSFQVDMSNVSYLSSAGLRAFLGAQKKSSAAGISMTLTGVSRQVMEIFNITGFSGILTII